MVHSIVMSVAGECTHADPPMKYEWHACLQISCPHTRNMESMSKATHTQSSAEWRRDGVFTTVVLIALLHESFASKNTRVTADMKRRIGLRFVLNIANTDQLKNALIGPHTELGSDWDISSWIFKFLKINWIKNNLSFFSCFPHHGNHSTLLVFRRRSRRQAGRAGIWQGCSRSLESGPFTVLDLSWHPSQSITLVSLSLQHPIRGD